MGLGLKKVSVSLPGSLHRLLRHKCIEEGTTLQALMGMAAEQFIHDSSPGKVSTRNFSKDQVSLVQTAVIRILNSRNTIAIGSILTSIAVADVLVTRRQDSPLLELRSAVRGSK
jgi:hypothetical protein